MKRRFLELGLVLGLISVLVFSQKKLSEPTIIYRPPPLQREAPSPERPTEPRMLLCPNLERKPSVFSAEQITVNGVKLGMSFDEVWEKLGPPDRISGSPPFQFDAEYDSQHPWRIQYANAKVVSVSGTQVSRDGKHLAKSKDPQLSLEKKLGPPDHQHAAGIGGTPVYCWASSDIVFEVWAYDQDKVGSLYLGSPLFYEKQPHLFFWTGCGSVDEELYEDT